MAKQPQTKSKKEVVFDSKFRKRFEKALRKRKKVNEPLQEAIRNSERLTEQDYAIRINTRG